MSHFNTANITSIEATPIPQDTNKEDSKHENEPPNDTNEKDILIKKYNSLWTIQKYLSNPLQVSLTSLTNTLLLTGFQNITRRFHDTKPLESSWCLSYK